MMYKIKEAIVVEGIYDKIRLQGFINGLILTTGGFSVFNNTKLQQSIRTLADKTGIVILTDSDSAGFKIRSFVKQLPQTGTVLNAYIPEVYGREKRKDKDSAQGLLGVEGMRDDIILTALTNSGAHIDGCDKAPSPGRLITKADLFSLGLFGRDNSSQLRKKTAKELGLPSQLSSNMYLDVINRLLTFEELKSLVEDSKKH